MDSNDTPGSRLVTWTRWLLVLPAALLARFAVHYAVAVFIRLTGGNVVGTASLLPDALRGFLGYVAASAVLVIAGALTAPRRQSLVASILAGLFLVLSAFRHIIVQYAVGNSVGAANFTHFGLEGLGLLGGAACVVIVVRRQDRRRRPQPDSSAALRPDP